MTCRNSHANDMKRNFYGFNLLGMFCRTKMENGDRRIFGHFPEDHFLWMREWLERNFIESWRPAINDGTFLHLGEFGCHQGNVPHATYLAWLEDVLKMCRRHGWGWALWNLDGTFGILDTPRTDCEFEDFRGHRLDRKALDLLRKYKT